MTAKYGMSKFEKKEAVSNMPFLERFIVCLSISISILHTRQLVNHCMIWIFVVNTSRHVSMYEHSIHYHFFQYIEIYKLL